MKAPSCGRAERGQDEANDQIRPPERLQRNGGDQRVSVHGFTADIAFISPQGLGVYAGVDHIGVTQTPSTGFHVGARLESGWAMAAVGVTAALFAVVWVGLGG